MYVKIPHIRTKAKDIFQTKTSDYCPDANIDRTTSTDAQEKTVNSTNPDDMAITAEELQTTSPMVVDIGKVSIDQDTQKPGSQRESEIQPGHNTQEPSIQSMDEDRDYIIPDEQAYPDNAQGNLSLNDRELGLQLTVFSAATSMKSLRSSIYGWNTQEPSVQSTETVPEVQVPQEPSVQKFRRKHSIR